MDAKARPVEQGSAPGLLTSVTIAVISGVIFWIELSSSGPSAMPNREGVQISELGQVDERDIAGALTTMAGAPSYLTQFKGDSSGCPRPLAWVSVVRTSGKPGSTFRVQSGAYYSPLFRLTDTPVRVAIPFPGQYDAGKGQLTVITAGGSATISLVPAWQVTIPDGITTHEVVWTPSSRCKVHNG